MPVISIHGIVWMAEWAMRLRSVIAAASRATLTCAVSHVLSVSSEEKMTGINATWIIASMASLSVIGDAAVFEQPGKAVCVKQFATPSRFSDHTVITDSSSSPQPAILRALNFSPKAFDKRFPHRENLS